MANMIQRASRPARCLASLAVLSLRMLWLRSCSRRNIFAERLLFTHLQERQRKGSLEFTQNTMQRNAQLPFPYEHSTLKTESQGTGVFIPNPKSSNRRKRKANKQGEL